MVAAGPVRTVVLYLVDLVELASRMGAAGWEKGDDSWVLQGRGWTATVEDPVSIDWRTVPDRVSQLQVGIGWRVLAELTGVEAGLPRLTRAVREIARLGHGVVVDGDQVWKPGPSRRLAPVAVKDQNEFLTLSWWAEAGRLTDKEVTEALVGALTDVLPEAIPRRWNMHPGRATVPEGAGSLADCIAAPGFSFFEVRSPFTEFAVHDCLWPPGGGHGVRRFNIRSFGIELCGSVLSQAGWGAHLSRVFRLLSEVIRPFYGEARLQPARYIGKVRHIDQPPPVSAHHWYGFPRSAPLAMVVGPPYRERWDRPGGDELGPLVFYTSDRWPDPPAGGVPLAPASFLQEHDIGWKEVPPIFPGLGSGVTGDHPTRIPEFWPFEETASESPMFPPPLDFLGLLPGDPDTIEPEPGPIRRYEFPSLDLGNLPDGSYFTRVEPAAVDVANAGRRLRHIEPAGRTWLEWSQSFHRAFAQDSSARRDPAIVPAGAEPASTTLDRLLREVVGPALAERGLKRSRGTFRLRRGEGGEISLQKSTHSRRGLAEFTFNLYGLHTPWTGRWSRIGTILPEMGDTWWVIPAGTNTDRLEADLLEALVDYAVPFLETDIETTPQPEDPGDPPWDRPVRMPAPPRPIFQIYPEPPTLEQLLADALDGNPAHNPADRAAVIQEVCWRARGDRRVTPILLELLANEPGADDRCTAALRLAFTDVDPELVRPAMTFAAEHDPEPVVRLMARYALKLLARRPDPIV